MRRASTPALIAASLLAAPVNAPAAESTAPSVVECAAASLSPESETDWQPTSKDPAAFDREYADAFGWPAIMLRGAPSEAELTDLLGEVMRLGTDPDARRATLKACGALQASRGYATLPAPPGGDPQACLGGAEDALEQMESLQPGQTEQACAAMSDVASAHQSAMRRLEAGQVSCHSPRSAWIHHAQLALKSKMLAAAFGCRSTPEST